MDAFISRKRRVQSPPSHRNPTPFTPRTSTPQQSNRRGQEESEEEASTDLKLATLASLYPDVAQEALLESLVAADGSVEAVCRDYNVSDQLRSPRKGSKRGIGFQTSLAGFRQSGSDVANDGMPQMGSGVSKKPRTLTKKGQTLHLYTPEDIAAHTPCSIIHNFLPAAKAEELLRELLEESPTFPRQTFKLFDNVVQSPHTACFYVDSLEEVAHQKTEYLYNGSFLTDIRQITPKMRQVSVAVQSAVNKEIATRIQSHYPNGQKLNYQSPKPWIPNAAFVNCYKGGAESVGYHSDQLTYLGPRAVIGSLSFGVAREFRVRKIVPQLGADDEVEASNNNTDVILPLSERTGKKPQQNKKQQKEITAAADAQGQISIHLPHNSLLVMHAEMQEEWKHSIHPAKAIDPHPVSGNKRINITYRYYRDAFHPRYTPRCKCNTPAVLRCAQRKKESKGRYMWMCHVGNKPGEQGCNFFQWAEFDDDGEPPWVLGFRGEGKVGVEKRREGGA